MAGCRHCHSYDGQSWPEAAGKGKMHHVLILIFINIVLIQFPFFDPWLHQMFGSNEVTNPELSQILRFISYWEAIIAIFSSCVRWNWYSSLLTATWPNKLLQPEGDFFLGGNYSFGKNYALNRNYALGVNYAVEVARAPGSDQSGQTEQTGCRVSVRYLTRAFTRIKHR